MCVGSIVQRFEARVPGDKIMKIGDHVEWHTRVRGHTYKGEIMAIQSGEFGVRWYEPDHGDV